MSLTKPVTAMMLAMDKNKLIGSQGGMPWRVPGELAYFKRVTMGKPVIMGRKTFESMGKPLSGRTNIVVTRNTQWQADGVNVVASIESALTLAGEIAMQAETLADEIFVIGGAGLCREAMPLTQRFYLTVIDHEFEGDTWLDSFSWDDWEKISHEVRDPETTDGLPVTYWVLEKKQ